MKKGLLLPMQVKYLRQKSGLTQKNFARMLGVSEILIAKIETGGKPVSRGFCQRLANRLNQEIIIKIKPEKS